MGPERSGGFTFGGLKLDPGVLAEEVHFFKFNFEVLDRPGRDAHVICVIMIVVGDDCGGRFVMRLVYSFITSAAYC